jgi:hypothetical protein
MPDCKPVDLVSDSPLAKFPSFAKERWEAYMRPNLLKAFATPQPAPPALL